MKFLGFLGLSHWISLIFVLLFFPLLYVLGHLPKKKLSFAVRVLIGTAAGTILGLLVWLLSNGFYFGPGQLTSLPFAGDLAGWFGLVAKGYVALLACLILPMVFLASARLVVRTPAEKTVSKVTKWKKWVNTLMVAVSSTIALVLGIFFRVGVIPGSGAANFTTEGSGILEYITTLIPAGLGQDLIFCNVIGIFVFGIYVGIAMRRMSVKSDNVKSLIGILEGAFTVGVSVCKTVIAYKPMGACAIMAWLLVSHGPVVLWVILKMLLVLTLGALIMLIFQLLLSALFGMDPATFITKAKPVMIEAIKTRSGSGCLPDAQKILSEDMGLNKEVTDVVSAYSISSGMQGCGALFPTTAALFALGLNGMTVTPGLAVLLVVVITLVSYGITDLPGTATMSEFASTMGIGGLRALPGLGAMIAIDPIGDVPRTLINVTGCMTNAIIVERATRSEFVKSEEESEEKEA